MLQKLYVSNVQGIVHIGSSLSEQRISINFLPASDTEKTYRGVVAGRRHVGQL